MGTAIFYFNYDQEIKRALTLIENGVNVFVYGPPMSGKSSFLKRIMEEFQKKGECQLINGRSMNSYEKMEKAIEKLNSILKENKKFIFFIDDLELISNTRLFCERLRGLESNFPKLILFITGSWKAERYFFQYSAPFFRMFESISLTNLSSTATSEFFSLFFQHNLKEKIKINKELEDHLHEITYGHIGTVSKLMNILLEHFKQLNEKIVVDEGKVEDVITKNVDKFQIIDNENLKKLSEKQREIYKALLRLKRASVRQITNTMDKRDAIIAKQLSRMAKKLFVVKEGHEYFPRVPMISEYVYKRQIENFDGYPEKELDKGESMFLKQMDNNQKCIIAECKYFERISRQELYNVNINGFNYTIQGPLCNIHFKRALEEKKKDIRTDSTYR